MCLKELQNRILCFISVWSLFCSIQVYTSLHFLSILLETKKIVETMLKGKFKQLTDSSILLLSAFFIDILDPAKIFSLASQKEDFDLINMIDSLDDVIFSYELHI